MIRAFLLLCLISRENFAFTVRDLFQTSTSTTLTSVGQGKNGNVSISTTTHANVTLSVSSTPSFVRNGTTTKPHKRRIKGVKETTTQKGALRRGKNATIRSFIPFTEANFEDQLKKRRPSTNKGNLNTVQDFIVTAKTTAKIQPRKLNLEDFNIKLSTMTPFLSLPRISDFPRVYETIEDVSKIDRVKYKDYADVIPLLKPEDSSYPYTHLVARHAKDPDNPIFGDQPFFSFILNDYFDRSIDDDPMIFRDLHWGNEFDTALKPKRIRRLDRDYEEHKAEVDSLQAVNYDAKYAKEHLHKRMNAKKHYSASTKGFNGFVGVFAQKFGSSDEGSKSANTITDIPKQNNIDPLTSGEILEELASIYDDRKVTHKDTSLSSASGLQEYSNTETSLMSSLSSDPIYSSSVLSRLRYLAKRDALFNNADYIDTSEFFI